MNKYENLQRMEKFFEHKYRELVYDFEIIKNILKNEIGNNK